MTLNTGSTVWVVLWAGLVMSLATTLPIKTRTKTMTTMKTKTMWTEKRMRMRGTNT